MKTNQNYICDKCGETTVFYELESMEYKNKLCPKCNDGILHKEKINPSNDVNCPNISYSYGKEKSLQALNDRVGKQRDIGRKLGLI